MAKNEIKDFTTLDGMDVADMNDGALFNRIAGLNKELKELSDLGVTGPAVDANKAVLQDKIAKLTAIVNGRYEEAAEE